MAETCWLRRCSYMLLFRIWPTCFPCRSLHVLLIALGWVQPPNRSMLSSCLCALGGVELVGVWGELVVCYGFTPWVVYSKAGTIYELQSKMCRHVTVVCLNL